MIKTIILLLYIVSRHKVNKMMKSQSICMCLLKNGQDLYVNFRSVQKHTWEIMIMLDGIHMDYGLMQCQKLLVG
ncbi:unnamed protein product [Paramecium octaurelia]|uniref:Uncharacterized protein n=1 Tax=Paramecium octaurelia TaxID=43137 RepID=A0A8S1SVZ3_PAROT|nr:unnamed protein product [Paramecium octaurelia]